MTSVYLCQDIYGFDLQQALARVSGQRRQQALRYRQERDRRLCVAAYRLLQLALQRQYGIGDPPQFTYTSKGKPLLAGHRHIHCSLSHCQIAAAVAVSDHPVGIDIETRDHYSEEVAARVMSGDEMRRILTSTDPAGEFTHLWTMKESLYKLTGDDSSGDSARMLEEADDDAFRTIDGGDWILTVCLGRASHADGLDLVLEVVTIA